MYYSSAKKCLLVSTFLRVSIFGGCNPVVTTLSAYGWILRESGPYPFLQRHTMPRIQIGDRLTEYLIAEAKIGRIRSSQVEIAVAILLSYLHHFAMSETIGAQQGSARATITDAINALWQGLEP